MVKSSSQTTKVRVVFSASRPSSNYSSLNDHLLVGPKLHIDLIALIIRWRSHRFVYSTDIEKMFRQIRVHSTDRDFQRIFWRPDPTAELATYRLLTVTYGTASAPFLANRVLKQLARDERDKFPQAAEVLENDIYVDDLMFGDEDVDSLQRIREQLVQLLRAGGFRTHKWASNQTCLLDAIPPLEREVASLKELDEASSNLHTLGVVWNPRLDTFGIRVEENPLTRFTKRSFLSLLARLYDLLGWVTVTAKIILQLLWVRKIGWDEQMPDDLAQRCSARHNY